MKKRLIALILCAVMVLSVLPLASAEGGEIGKITINGVPTPTDGAAIPYDSSTLIAAEPQLYKAYYWNMSWRVSDGIINADLSPTFDAGELYTLTLLIVPQNGATGLDETTAATLPVFIGGQKAKYDPDCKPPLDAEPGKEVFAYDVELRCAWTNEIRMIDVYGMILPATGATPCAKEDLFVPENAPYEIAEARWFKYKGAPGDETDEAMGSGEKFEDGKWYYLAVEIAPKDGAALAEDCCCRINGSSNLVDDVHSRLQGGNFRIFTADWQATSRHIDIIELNGAAEILYVGDPAKTAFENVTIPAGAGYTLVTDWKDVNVSKKSNDTYIKDDDLFEAGESYMITLRVAPKEGWTIDSSTVWRINGRMDLVLGAKDSTSGYWYCRSVAIPATERTHIDRVQIFGVTDPVAGWMAIDCTTTYVANGPYELVERYWLNDDDDLMLIGDDAFELGKHYMMCNVVKPYEGYVIDDSTVFELNGGDYAVELSGGNPDGSYYVWTEPKEPLETCIVCWYQNVDDEMPVTGAEVIKGDVFGEPAVPGKDGYIFGGWYTDKELTKPYDPNAPILEDTNLYPLWIPVIAVTAVDAKIAAPAVGQKPSEAVTLTVTPPDANVVAYSVDWYYWDETTSGWEPISDSTYVFAKGVTYSVDIFIDAGDQTEFDPAITGTVNGKPSDTSYAPVFTDSTHIYLSYQWDLSCLHAATEVKDAVDATCLTDGYTGDTYCKECGEKIADGTVIPALGHDYKDGVCTRCGAADPNAKPCDGGKDCPSKNFTDVNYGDWYHEAVDFAVTKGLFNGMTPTTFEPNTPMSRAMLVTVLWRYEGEKKEGTNGFDDVPAGQWYTDAVAWAAKNGIVNGVGEGKFDPNGKITREQLAAILYRYSDGKGYDVTKRGDLTTFPDASKVSGWAKDAYAWAVGEGLITGNDGKLDPQGNATRAQVATILMRFINKFA